MPNVGAEPAPRRKRAGAIAAVLGALALLVVFTVKVAWRSLAIHPTGAEIEVCRFVLARQSEQLVALWHARARGEEPPEADETSNVWQACAPLYAEPACREALLHANEGDPATRVRRVVEGCRDAYCPKLDPKPRMCAEEANAPGGAKTMRDLSVLWRELDEAILTHDLQERAAPLLAARRQGSLEVETALHEYFDAGSPQWRGHSGAGIRMVPGAAAGADPGAP
jgi:hypothetical protein